ncbi:hypothetical protein HPB47_000829 [Ixodes persulcatus]|uniref:Uncharacterized protein n=1 Tax=Ixodes persulcatus TaxID=34615 RepID=A0AC60PRY6_IXOPE|nr:hypothetical protein HPB47_000829 [Ixodes persulcatus]
MELYREHFPHDVDDPGLNENYRFYLNELASRPNGLLIEDMLSQWWGKYDILETNHDYMPWSVAVSFSALFPMSTVLSDSNGLFPTRGKSHNPACQRLQLHEAQSMKQDPVVQARLMRSYKMMLDFFGLELLDEAKGVVDKAPHWEIRFLNLNRSLHNSMRITRILKSLGEVGLEHLKYPLVEFLLKQVLKEKTLSRLEDSLLTYWVHTIRSDNDRRFLLCVAEAVMDKFVPDAGQLIEDRRSKEDEDKDRTLLRSALLPATRCT